MTYSCMTANRITEKGKALGTRLSTDIAISEQVTQIVFKKIKVTQRERSPRARNIFIRWVTRMSVSVYSVYLQIISCCPFFLFDLKPWSHFSLALLTSDLTWISFFGNDFFNVFWGKEKTGFGKAVKKVRESEFSWKRSGNAGSGPPTPPPSFQTQLHDLSVINKKLKLTISAGVTPGSYAGMARDLLTFVDFCCWLLILARARGGELGGGGGGGRKMWIGSLCTFVAQSPGKELRDL